MLRRVRGVCELREWYLGTEKKKGLDFWGVVCRDGLERCVDGVMCGCEGRMGEYWGRLRGKESGTGFRGEGNRLQILRRREDTEI